jgi:tRNA pseudouridine55 synthase
MDKTYTATARLGAVSDTLDAEGEVHPVEGPSPDAAAIRSKLPEFTGPIEQVPPMASALKVGGRRLYDLHRRGIEVERSPRPVFVHAFVLLSTDPLKNTATFEVSCSSGTYVRSLISDLAESLDSGAYLTDLRRTRVGHMHVKSAHHTEDLEQDLLFGRIIQPSDVLVDLPAVEVDEGAGVCFGRRLGAFGVEGSYRVTMGGELLAVYRDEGDEARAEVVLCAR